MARRGQRRPSADTNDNANSIDELLGPSILDAPPSPVSRLDEFIGPSLPFDRREFSPIEPELFRLKVANPTITSGGAPSRNAVLVPKIPTNVAFSNRDTVAICHRRQVRREVLHALKRIKGRGGSRRRKWSSNIKC